MYVWFKISVVVIFVEYILLAYFCLGNKNENGSLLQQLVLRNTVYVCGKYVYGSSWMCGPTAIPLDKSQVRLMFLLAFSYSCLSDVGR